MVCLLEQILLLLDQKGKRDPTAIYVRSPFTARHRSMKPASRATWKKSEAAKYNPVTKAHHPYSALPLICSLNGTGVAQNTIASTISASLTMPSTRLISTSLARRPRNDP